MFPSQLPTFGASTWTLLGLIILTRLMQMNEQIEALRKFKYVSHNSEAIGLTNLDTL